MSLTVKNWRLKELWHAFQDRELDLSPDYQRREAWSDKKKMILIDSVARGIPINAVTLYKTSDSNLVVYEVIDGKQRITSLIQFLQDEISPIRESLRDLSEEEELEGKELAEKIMDRRWSELDRGTRSQFLEYEVPIYVVEGSRASAVRAFRRMNADPYALNPQEIRNAVFKDSAFLKAAKKLANTVDAMANSSDHFLVEWGVMSDTQWTRMQDLQFLSEILCLCINGPQEARRTLDTIYEDFFSPHGQKRTILNKAVDSTEKAIKAARIIVGPTLKAHCLDTENDLYALLGALFSRGIPSTPQLEDKETVEDLRGTISTFGNQVLLCQQAYKDADEEQIQRFCQEVKEYACTFLGGQVNGAKRRKSRIDIMIKLINDRIKPLEPKSPSDLQRRLVWAQSLDKMCGRCGKEVDYKDYDCGHIDPKAFGGRAIISNLRVEHSSCNRKAKAK